MATLMVRVKKHDGQGSVRYPWRIVQFADRKRKKPIVPADVVGWGVRYTENGKRTMNTFQADALSDAMSWLHMVEAAELTKQFIRNASQSQSQLKPQASSSQSSESSLSLGDAIAKYLDERKDRAPGTLYSYRAGLEEFASTCKKPCVGEITREDLLAYKDCLRARGINDTTTHNRILRVVIFLKRFGVTKLLGSSDWPRLKKKVPDAYSEDEIQALLKAANPEERLLLEFFLYSGAREGEVAHATKGDIKLLARNGTRMAIFSIEAKDELKWTPKSRRDRDVRLPLEFAERLLKARAGRPDTALLFANGQGRPSYHLLKIVKKVAKRAGVKNATLHKFRRTYATLKSEHQDIQSIAKALGHRDVATTMRYLEAKDAKSEAEGQATEAAFSRFVAQQ